MVDIDTIESEIIDLERRDTTFATCERLAWLYVVRDHLAGGPVTGSSPRRSGVVAMDGGSEFLSAASRVDIGDLLSVMDEHMEALRVVQPKAYEATMDRILSLDESHQSQD